MTLCVVFSSAAAILREVAVRKEHQGPKLSAGFGIGCAEKSTQQAARSSSCSVLRTFRCLQAHLARHLCPKFDNSGEDVYL
jgi:hypothetical protein